MKDLNMMNIALEMYKMEVIDKEQLSDIIGFDFNEGKWTEPDTVDSLHQLSGFLIELYNISLISSKTLVKETFGLEAKKELWIAKTK